MEFYLAPGGRLAAMVVAILIGLWLTAATHVVRDWSLHPAVISLIAASCLTIAFGLYYMKWWARDATITVLAALLIWISLDVPRLVFAKSYPAWYASVPLIGNDMIALDIVFAIDLLLLVLLIHCRDAFGGRRHR